MVSNNRTNALSGQMNPALVVAVILIAACAAGGAWYLLRQPDENLGDMKVMVNGKEVDPKLVLKGGTVKLPGGGSFTFSKEGVNPGALMGETFKDYFSLPEGPQRKKYLDDMIDQQEKAKKELGVITDGEGMTRLKAESATTKPGENRAIVMRSSGGGAMDSMPPETRAQIAEFMKAINDRRAERGLPPQQGMMMFKTKKQ